jgi:biofilm PGA synthesis N-glycosyltransferase PgaC
VVDAFYEGYQVIEKESWDYLIKLDGDLSFDGDYFERCFEQFDENPRLGIAGGTICDGINGVVEASNDPRFHVRGATKIYRGKCWREIGGIIRSTGWDTLDEVKANMLCWATCTLPDIYAIHHRPTGIAYGIWRDRVKGGVGNYVAGYHPLFMFAKCIKRLTEKPYVVGSCGLLYGFLKVMPLESLVLKIRL